MKSFIPTLVLILFLTSCSTTNNTYYYSDPNYLGSDEFSSYEEVTNNRIKNQVEEGTDTILDSENEYTINNYYDYSYSSRIRRFHRPIYYSGYYGGIYTDYFWYSNDPFYCGTSIYYGYNWHSPYYSYHNYSPYYYPYYFGNYYSYNGYGYYNNHYNTLHNPYNINNHDAYISGHRGSLSSNINRGKTGVRTNNNTIITLSF